MASIDSNNSGSDTINKNDDGEENLEQNLATISANEEDTTVPEEQVIEQQAVPFLDDDLMAALTEAGSIFVTLPGMCNALGLNTQAQLRRIRRTKALNKGLRRVLLDTKGGEQLIYCLRIDRVALWLGGLQTDNLKEEFRPKIELYQDELAPVATKVFMRVLNINNAALTVAAPEPPVISKQQAEIDQTLVALLEQLRIITGVSTFLQEHVEGILETRGQVTEMSFKLDNAIQMLEALTNRQEAVLHQQEELSSQQYALANRQLTTETTVARIDDRTQRLTPLHQRQIQTYIDRMVRETKNQANPLAYAYIYGNLKNRFGAGSYKEIADEQFDAVMQYLQQMLSRATGGQSPEQARLF